MHIMFEKTAQKFKKLMNTKFYLKCRLTFIWLSQKMYLDPYFWVWVLLANLWVTSQHQVTLGKKNSPVL